MLDAYTFVPAHRGRFTSVSSPGAVARPQAVDARRSPRYHALLAALGEQMGHPVALNTSLNAPGMTIAWDLPQVVDDCAVLGVNAAWIDGLLVEGPALRAAAGTLARHPMAAAHANGG
jgi:predicted NodU family carbamoyl transferase